MTCQVATVTCTRNDALPAGGSYPLTVTVTIGYTPPYTTNNMAAVSGGGEINTANDQASDILIINQLPDLTVTCTHTGDFYAGMGAITTISVTNIGQPPSSGLVTVVDTLPSGLTATAMSGVGWNCTLATLTCTRSDGLAGRYTAVVYYPLTLTVNVSTTAPVSVTNMAAVSGGGEGNTANDQATDLTTIVQPASLTVTSTHTGNFFAGETGATYTLTVTNSGAMATGGAVTLTDTLPAAMTATAIRREELELHPRHCYLHTQRCAGARSKLRPRHFDRRRGARGVRRCGERCHRAGQGRYGELSASDPTAIIGACDVNRAGSYTISDVRTARLEALGLANPVDDFNGDGRVDAADVEVAINAALGLGCVVSN